MAELQSLVERLARRVGRSLERQGLLVRDTENDFLAFGPEAGGAMDDLIGHSITCRVAVGPRAGQKVFALQTVPAREAEPRPGVAQCRGFRCTRVSGWRQISARSSKGWPAT